MPLVSIIMPSYNHDRYISEAIESVLNQTVSNFELIIVDDMSIDRSRQIIDRYADNDRRIKKIFHPSNVGIARTVNDGLDAARGKYIALFASDDLWIPQKLERQLPVLKKNNDSIVWSEGLVVDSKGKPTGELFTEKHGAKDKSKSGNLFSQLINSNYICGQSCIFKKEIASDIRFDVRLKYFNDYKFQLDLANRHEYYFISEPLVKYRIHGNNSILKNANIWRKDYYILARYILRRYGNVISLKTKEKLYRRSFRYLCQRNHFRCANLYGIKMIRINPLKISYYKEYLTAYLKNHKIGQGL